jgi:flagellar basal-body rod modification protein FlgD
MASSVSSIAPAANRADATTDNISSRVPQKQLGQGDFLKLLAVQFQVQDPMKPMEDTAFIAQMAQFSSLEQSSSMAKDLTALRSDQQRVTANSYLGHRVTFETGETETFTGYVDAVDASGTEPRLVSGERSFPLNAVLKVEPRILTTTTPAPAPQPAPATGEA